MTAPESSILTALPTNTIPTSSLIRSDSPLLSPTDSATSDNQEYNSGYPDNKEPFSNLPTSASFGNTIYAGAVTFETPKKSKSMYPLYPIQSNANVTFKWGYTALRVRPVNLTLDAVGPNSVTYTIANLNGSATEATWNLASVPTETPLMMGYYKVQLYDQRGLSVNYSPGWMIPCTTLSIGLYSVDTYDPFTTLNNYCPLCFYNAGTSIRGALGPILATLGVALLTSVIILINIFN
ncbi:hypothetical protein BDF20DRAFT_819080 [Mycotypha africana]|uniref:uncharacterized protein n=1 Tax=Mycotypha africana TaxID=64632 RepID=UPI002300AFF3|nr:uncharacterized protein BDF20DRAFT_819080 [Mycotypha africana]KAI8979539.1 hypothetical protein BDF20DRAFT_819080 [Mycotypha africana]